MTPGQSLDRVSDLRGCGLGDVGGVSLLSTRTHHGSLFAGHPRARFLGCSAWWRWSDSAGGGGPARLFGCFPVCRRPPLGERAGRGGSRHMVRSWRGRFALTSCGRSAGLSWATAHREGSPSHQPRFRPARGLLPLPEPSPRRRQLPLKRWVNGTWDIVTPGLRSPLEACGE
jgi:hypothetical protein